MAAFKARILSFNARFMLLAAQAKRMQLFSIQLFSFKIKNKSGRRNQAGFCVNSFVFSTKNPNF